MRIIISLTSYPPRYETLHLCLASLFAQSKKPDLIILYIFKENLPIPETVLKYLDYGLEIKLVDDDLKPHNKYYYAMSDFRKDILITVDDDAIYPFNFVELLIQSYLRFPTAISAGRAHIIRLDTLGKPLKYLDWEWESTLYNYPSHKLLATGVGGILYPPNCLDSEVFNKVNIKRYCLVQDDIWLKCMALISKIPIVLTKQNSAKPVSIPEVWKNGLYLLNKYEGGNDKAFSALIQEYSIDLKRIFDTYEKI